MSNRKVEVSHPFSTDMYGTNLEICFNGGDIVLIPDEIIKEIINDYYKLTINSNIPETTPVKLSYMYRIIKETNGFGESFFIQKSVRILGIHLFWDKYAYFDDKKSAEKYIKGVSVPTTLTVL